MARIIRICDELNAEKGKNSIYKTSQKMFSLRSEDTEATHVANFNVQIINFRSLKKNRETFLKLVPGSRTYYELEDLVLYW